MTPLPTHFNQQGLVIGRASPVVGRQEERGSEAVASCSGAAPVGLSRRPTRLRWCWSSPRSSSPASAPTANSCVFGSPHLSLPALSPYRRSPRRKLAGSGGSNNSGSSSSKRQRQQQLAAAAAAVAAPIEKAVRSTHAQILQKAGCGCRHFIVVIVHTYGVE
uniref:Uncharacterized protein n=1 Tax=Oryza glumipatula TaxID=40148 RepID=A0A0E0A790_9ORYZ